MNSNGAKPRPEDGLGLPMAKGFAGPGATSARTERENRSAAEKTNASNSHSQENKAGRLWHRYGIELQAIDKRRALVAAGGNSNLVEYNVGETVKISAVLRVLRGEALLNHAIEQSGKGRYALLTYCSSGYSVGVHRKNCG